MSFEKNYCAHCGEIIDSDFDLAKFGKITLHKDNAYIFFKGRVNCVSDYKKENQGFNSKERLDQERLNEGAREAADVLANMFRAIIRKI